MRSRDREADAALKRELDALFPVCPPPPIPPGYPCCIFVIGRGEPRAEAIARALRRPAGILEVRLARKLLPEAWVRAGLLPYQMQPESGRLIAAGEVEVAVLGPPGPWVRLIEADPEDVKVEPAIIGWWTA